MPRAAHTHAKPVSKWCVVSCSYYTVLSTKWCALSNGVTHCDGAFPQTMQLVCFDAGVEDGKSHPGQSVPDAAAAGGRSSAGGSGDGSAGYGRGAARWLTAPALLCCSWCRALLLGQCPLVNHSSDYSTVRVGPLSSSMHTSSWRWWHGSSNFI